MNARLLVPLALLLALAAALFLFFAPAEDTPLQPEVAPPAAPEVAAEAAPELDVAPLPVAGAERVESRAVKAAPPLELPAALAAAPLLYRDNLAGVRGRVVEADGTPVAGIGLELFGAAPSDFFVDPDVLFSGAAPEVAAARGATRSDEEGRFQFAHMDPLAHHALALDLGGPRATVRFLDAAPGAGEVRDLGDVVLEPAVVIAGRVVDHAGNPVGGARVRATNLPSVMFQFGAANLREGAAIGAPESGKYRIVALPAWVDRLVARLPLPTAHTADDGSFELAGAPPGSTTIVVDQGGAAPLVHGPLSLAAGDGARDLGTMKLSKPEELRGRVQDTAGEPVAGADVLVGPKIGMFELTLFWSVGKTGADGSFAATGLSDEDHVLAARRPGALDWTVLRDQVPGIDEPVIVLEATADLLVTVVDKAGNTLPKPDLALRSDFELAQSPVLIPPVSLAGRVRHRDDGTAEISDLEKSSYVVIARVPGYAAGTANVDLSSGAQSVRVELVPARALAVRVLARATKEPVEYARVAAYPGDNQHGPPQHLASARTGADGRAALSGLADGPGLVRVEHPAFATASLPVEIGAADHEVVFELAQGGSIVGRVHSEGRPPDAPRFLVFERRGSDIEFPRTVVTDLEGNFALRRIQPGTLRVEVFRRAFHQSPGKIAESIDDTFDDEHRTECVVEEGQESRLDIDLAGLSGDGPTARMTGRILVNGRPGSGIQVDVRSQEDWRRHRRAQSDASGRFDCGIVPAGKINLTLERTNSASGRSTGVLTMRTFELAANDVRDVLIEIETGRVRGRVVTALDGRAVAGAGVSLQRIQEPTPGGAEPESSDWTYQGTQAEADGTFLFPEVPKGNYRVEAEAEGYVKASVLAVAVQVNGEPPLVELKLSVGVPVEGKLDLGDVTDARWIHVWLKPKDDSNFSDGVQVDIETLAFKIEHILPGEYEAHVNVMRQVGETFDQVPFAPVSLTVPEAGATGVVLRPARQGS